MLDVHAVPEGIEVMETPERPDTLERLECLDGVDVRTAPQCVDFCGKRR